MSARSQLTRRSESGEAEDADEDKCTAKSGIVPALTWDGIEGLYTLHCPRGIGCTVYNLTTSFHSAGKHPFSENPSLSSVPCRCMSVPTADWIRTIGHQGGKWRNEICMKMEFCKSQLIRQGSLIPFQQKCMDKKHLDTDCKQIDLQYITHLATQTSNYCSTYWGFCSGSFPLVSLRLGSCAGAFTIHVGCRHDPKEDQASDTTHIHICLATEILSRILNVRSVVSAANGKHSDDPTMGRAEKLL